MDDLYSQICQKDTLRKAFARVAANHGCQGSDGIRITDFQKHLYEHLEELGKDLQTGNYHPFPLLEFSIPKHNKSGVRYLRVPTVRDRVAQTAVFLVTQAIFEAEFETVSHAYREGRGVRSAVEEIQRWAKKGYRFAMDADIEGYFDNVDHALLLKKSARLIPETRILKLIQKWVKAEVYNGKSIVRLSKGLPQGSVISPPLANLFLDELDETLIEFGLKLVRYSDDFLVLCKTPQEAQTALEITDMMLQDLKLNLNLLKTKVVSFDQGFKFLGAIFLSDGVYLPFPKKRENAPRPHLPPPLTLKRYLELKCRDE